jgi:hypothetical protein
MKKESLHFEKEGLKSIENKQKIKELEEIIEEIREI